MKQFSLLASALRQTVLFNFTGCLWELSAEAGGVCLSLSWVSEWSVKAMLPTLGEDAGAQEMRGPVKAPELSSWILKAIPRATPPCPPPPIPFPTTSLPLAHPPSGVKASMSHVDDVWGVWEGVEGEGCLGAVLCDSVTLGPWKSKELLEILKAAVMGWSLRLRKVRLAGRMEQREEAGSRDADGAGSPVPAWPALCRFVTPAPGTVTLHTAGAW